MPDNRRPFIQNFKMNSKSQHGFIRDRMSQLTSIRNACQHTSPDTSMGTRLIGPDGTSQTDNSILQHSNNIEPQFIEIENDLTSLNEKYNRRIAALSSFDDDVIESEIEALTASITKKLIRLKNQISTKNLFARSSEAAQISSNMEKGYLARTRDLSIRFREMQSNYLKRLNAIKSKAESSSIAVSIDEGDNSIEDDFNVPFTGAQNAMAMENDMAIQKRNEEINRLLGQMEEMKGLFLDLSKLIQEQGTILDRIDNNIDVALDEVKQGNKELEQAEKHQKSKAFFIYLIAMIILIIILGTVIIIRKAKRKKNDSSNNDNNNNNDDDSGSTNRTSSFLI